MINFVALRLSMRNTIGKYQCYCICMYVCLRESRGIS